MILDLDALKAQLREYDKSLPKCPKRVARKVQSVLSLSYEPYYDEPYYYEYTPCCRPADHDGECRSTRPVLGWPGYEVLKELIEIASAFRSDYRSNQ